ncbi:TetR/AcrR family transcriptional regulator [Pseudocolwellia agarivorans]|uniref:TetR/AcrR family transcriptional regulator n=1 Tax=Pseudocolwellia agarivorans TaxID=1911682 RepID=UPI0009867266|nr:TetR/AcrR family transcriptional regulator [Pseudocolwellia agarivorans]
MSVAKANDKRVQLVNTALQLFYQQGIHAIGINEILAKSGIAKKTLYNHFASKEALIQACVIERDKRFMQWFKARCSNTSSTAEFVEHLFNALHDWINNRETILEKFDGCFFVNTAAEYGDTGSEIYQLCLQHKLNIKQFFQQQLAINISDTKQVNSLTDLLVQLKEGVINCAYVMDDKEAALKAKQLALTFLKH